MALGREEKEALLKKVRNARSRRYRTQYESSEKLARLGNRIRERQLKSNRKIIEEIAEKLSIDLNNLEREHAKTADLLWKTAKEEKKKLTNDIVDNIRYRKSIKTTIRKLRDSHYQVEKPNPGLLVCDWIAEGDDGNNNFVSNVNNIDHAVQRIRTGELGENDIRTRLEAEDDAILERRDWFEFIWEPDKNGIADITGVFQPTGVVTCIASEKEKLFNATATSIAQVVAWIDVAQDTNQGLNFFPEVSEAIYTASAEGEQVQNIQMFQEHTLNFHSQIPIVAGTPIVVTAGYQFLVSAAFGPCSAEIDLNSHTEFAGTVTAVLINMKT